ncbi:arginase [Prauserella shujinwangii]|uniref:Arginase n=1 Tax=Prauserella shujinwangii TaxID=1453103 RepID=A0A2T0LZ58_9PSEU|nr:arginase family protein [Prauserella shujinwangii]PRX49380.1 arginase [Prauserella shujinwangii]
MSDRHGIAVLDAPTNLGLRPPEEGSVPGCAKAPGMLRDFGLLSRLGARDAGVLTPPRYRPAWTPGTVRNERAIAAYSTALAERVAALRDRGEWPLLLGGDCSVLLGPALALRRAGRYGVVYLDAHLDFRHPGNSTGVGAAAGEGLALLTGRGGALAEIGGAKPYVRPEDIVAVGFRRGDEYTDEAAAAGIHLLDAPTVRADPAAAAAHAVELVTARGLDGFWVHLDVDIVDGELLPAVDSPEPGGLTWDELTAVLRPLLAVPRAAGLNVGIYDPDLDPTGTGARELVEVLAAAVSRW